MAMAYGADNIRLYDEMLRAFGGLPSLRKKDYEQLAKAIGGMADPIRGALSADGGATTRQIVEIIAAQIGLVLGADNKDFDSFRFVAAIEKNLK
jgi:hypothetical protein